MILREFNGYLYQVKRTAKEKARMWALLDKSLQIINRRMELEKTGDSCNNQAFPAGFTVS